MGKKQSSNIYETDQANKKHRKKSKKLEKREKHKKNKKKNKKEKGRIRKIEKYIKKGFKENKQEIDLAKLFGHCLDLEEILKQIKKILELNSNAVSEIPELLKLMEESKKEVNIAGIEDKTSQKHILKLFKNLKITQSTRNPFCFRITNLQRKRDLKMKYTTEIDDIISDSLSSYYLLVKLLFEYVNYVMNNPDEEENAECHENEGNEQDDEDDQDSSMSLDEEGGNSEIANNTPFDKKKMKEFEREKMEMDYEYDLLEEKLGKNAELINKAFNKIMQEDNTNKNLKNDDEEQELVGPPVPKFLEATMNLINSNEDENDAFNKILTTNTYSKGNRSLPVTSQKSKIEPINKESYDRLINYERERMKHMSEEIEDYDAKYRSTSLLEEYQQMNKEKKSQLSSCIQDQRKGFNRERDMNIGRIDSKRALSIMRENKGLQGRFEAKEKYIGY
jgi:hypothetical protein